MAKYVYKSTTGRVVNKSGYSITVNPGLEVSSPIKDLDSLVGTQLQRYTNDVLDSMDSAGATIATGSRNVTVSDNDTVIKCTAASTLTILSDALGGFNPTETNIIRAYQATAGAVTFAAGSGVTLRGSPKASAQYVVQMIIRVGPNEWAYMT